MSLLDSIASSQPIANQKRADQKRAARDFALQQAVGKQKAGAATTSTAQELGGAMAQQAGEQQVEQAGEAVQQGAELGGMDLQQQEVELGERFTGLRQGLQARNIEQEQQVFAEAQRLENESFAKRMEFQKDELGRLEANDQQLADYAVLSAQSDEQLRNYAQSSQLAYQRNIQFMEQASKVLQANMEFESKKAEQDKDQDLLARLAEQKRDLDKKIAREKAEADKNAQIWNTVLTIGVAAASAYAAG